CITAEARALGGFGGDRLHVAFEEGVNSLRLDELDRREIVIRISGYRLGLIQEVSGACRVAEHVLHICGHRQRLNQLGWRTRNSSDCDSAGQPWPCSRGLGP